MSGGMGLYMLTDDIKPFRTLGLVVTGETVYSNDSVYVFYYTPWHWDRPEDAPPHGFHIETLWTTLRPRALFELGPWMENNTMRNFADWLEMQFPSLRLGMPEHLLQNEPYKCKQNFIIQCLSACPWVWITPDEVREAWNEAFLLSMTHWEIFMEIGFNEPIEPMLLYVFSKAAGFRRGIFSW
ncbi:hypothetical protein F5Y09DRAFT_352341 [Xylaria sp. FL1042]|nr:hypothetical protein F5Y09DRAFT_352341 [Xylaria sp. FL1042]